MDWWLDKVTSTYVLIWQGQHCLGGLRLCPVSPSRSPRGNWRPRQLAPVHPAQRLTPLKGPPLMYLLPWRLGEQAMASPGWSRLRSKMTSRETGPQNVTGRNREGRKTDQPFPSCSRMRREDAPLPRSSTSIWHSSHQPATMWPPWE